MARRFVGRLDNGTSFVLVRKHDIPETVRALFEIEDTDLVMDEGQTLIDYCAHTDDYRYRHGCDEWCDRPVPRMVWTARYPVGEGVES